MRIAQRLALDTRHSLVEVVCDEHRYLIGISPNGLTPIAKDTRQIEDIDQTANNHISPRIPDA